MDPLVGPFIFQQLHLLDTNIMIVDVCLMGFNTIFSPEDRGSIFLQNVFIYLQAPRRYNPEKQHHLQRRENLLSHHSSGYTRVSLAKGSFVKVTCTTQIRVWQRSQRCFWCNACLFLIRKMDDEFCAIYVLPFTPCQASRPAVAATVNK